MALNPSNSSNLEQLALKGLIRHWLRSQKYPELPDNSDIWSSTLSRADRLAVIADRKRIGTVLDPHASPLPAIS